METNLWDILKGNEQSRPATRVGVMCREDGAGFSREWKFELSRVCKDIYVQRLGRLRGTVGWVEQGILTL